MISVKVADDSRVEVAAISTAIEAANRAIAAAKLTQTASITAENAASAAKDAADSVVEAQSIINNIEPRVTALQNKVSKIDKIQSSLNYVTPEMYGALGDAVNDDTTSIRKAIDYATKNNLSVQFYENYRITDTIDITCDINGLNSRIFYDGERDRPALRVDTKKRLDIKLGIIADIESVDLTDIENSTYYFGWHGWENEDYVGLMVSNSTDCDIYVKMIVDFTVGLQCRAYDGGAFGWNKIQFGHLYNNKIQQWIHLIGTASWINANTFVGGRIDYSDSGTEFARDASFDRRMLYFSAQNFVDANPSCNSNIFENYWVEHHCTVTTLTILAVECTIQHNAFNNWRCEIQTSDTVKFCIIDVTKNGGYYDVGTKNSHLIDNSFINMLYAIGTDDISWILGDKTMFASLPECFHFLKDDRDVLIFDKDYASTRVAEVFSNPFTLIQDTVLTYYSSKDAMNTIVLDSAYASADTIKVDGGILTTSQSGRCATLFMTVSQYDTIKVSNSGGMSYLVRCYDADYNMINSARSCSLGIAFNLSLGGYVLNEMQNTFTVIDENVKYVLLTFQKLRHVTIKSSSESTVCSSYPDYFESKWYRPGFKYLDVYPIAKYLTKLQVGMKFYSMKKSEYIVVDWDSETSAKKLSYYSLG